MAVSNSIFNQYGNMRALLVDSERYSSLDTGVMSIDEEKIFNTYRYWTPFDVPSQTLVKDSKSKDKEGNPETIASSVLGVKSLFNNYNAVVVGDGYRVNSNMPLLDNPESRKAQRKNMSCTIKDLVDASKNDIMGRQIYNYSDFAYCKHLGKISNNYLITLRRFAIPCGDRIDKRNYSPVINIEHKSQQHSPDIGRMVTWMGTPGNEMTNILKYNFGVQWEDQEAKIDEVDSGKGNKGIEGQGPLASLFNMANPEYRAQVQKGYAGASIAGKDMIEGMFPNKLSFNPAYDKSTWDRMYDSTKIYGPIDVIDKTKKRKRGLVFEQKMTLTFEYELRSYYGVNAKAAFMDLLGNILVTTYTHGTFWGGERRFIGGSQDNIYANLPIYNASEDGALGQKGVIDAITSSIKIGAKRFSDSFEGETAGERFGNMINGLAGMILGGALNKLGRPDKYAIASLMSGAPVGCWHLTIGNPKSPIIEVGNLICTNTEIEHFGPLGLDDFPTGLRVKVSLEHGKPRDIVGIEQMYGRGDTRIYSPLGKKVLDMYKNSTSLSKPKEITAETELGDLKLEKINIYSNSAGTQESMNIQASSENLKDVSSINSSKGDNNSIFSYFRYFGMEDEGIIERTGGESLYGSEKHKNDHVK